MFEDGEPVAEGMDAEVFEVVEGEQAEDVAGDGVLVDSVRGGVDAYRVEKVGDLIFVPGEHRHGWFMLISPFHLLALDLFCIPCKFMSCGQVILCFPHFHCMVGILIVSGYIKKTISLIEKAPSEPVKKPTRTVHLTLNM